MRKLVIFVILASILTVAAPAKKSGPVAGQEYPVMVAHRGGLLEYPEGTLRAFRGAAAVGAMIELDVWALKDGTLVVNHDETVDRTSDRTGKVADLTLAEWRQLRITDPKGGPPAPAATLQDVLDEFADTNTVLVPEIKDENRINEFVEQLWPHRDQVVVQSLTGDVVKRLAKTGLPTLQVTAKPETANIIPGVYAVNMKETMVTPAAIDRWRSAGVRLWSYMVNDQNRVDELIDMGIEGIMTDNPTLKAVIPS